MKRAAVMIAFAYFIAMGFAVTETTVWTRGKSRAFTPEEIQAGKAEDWLKANKADNRGKR